MIKKNVILLLVVIFAALHVSAQNSYASGISGGNPCCTQPSPNPCTPAPGCGPVVEAEEAMPPLSNNGCPEAEPQKCGDKMKLRLSAKDLDRKFERDIETPGMKKMELQYKRQELERKRDMKENEAKKRKLGAKLAKQTKARVALKNLEEQLQKQLSEVRSTLKVLSMEMRMVKNQMDSQSLDEPKLRIPKMSIMGTLKKMHAGQLKDLSGTHKSTQQTVHKAVTQAQAGLAPSSITNKIGNKLKKEQIKKAKAVVKEMKKDMQN